MISRSCYIFLDELIKLHKSIVKTSSDVDTQLAMALKDVNDSLSEQRIFAVAIKAFQKQLLHDLEASNSQVMSVFSKISNSMDIVTQSILSKLRSAVDHAELNVIELRNVGLQKRAS